MRDLAKCIRTRRRKIFWGFHLNTSTGTSNHYLLLVHTFTVLLVCDDSAYVPMPRKSRLQWAYRYAVHLEISFVRILLLP